MILNLPPYLLILIIILVIIPTLIAIVLRFALYRELEILDQNVMQLIKDSQHRSNIKKIIEDIEKRFTETSNNLDQVNTPALIDQVYSHQKLGLFYYEDIEYFIKILPNLLLAFGLLGTFLGITINLSSISQIVTQTQADNVPALLQQLQQPLQGMGIAFTTSLIGLFCSALLTVISLIFNTQKAKLRWVISLEDYLDNVFLPETQGDSRRLIRGNQPDNLSVMQQEISKLVGQIIRYTEGINLAIESMGDRFVDNVGKQLQQSTLDINNQLQAILNQIQNQSQINNINNNGKKQTQTTENEPDIIEQETYKKAVNVVKKGNYDQGLIMINNLLHNTADNPQFLLLRARIYQQKKELKLAREDYELILELSDNPNIRRYAEEGLRKVKEDQEIYNVMKLVNDD